MRKLHVSHYPLVMMPPCFVYHLPMTLSLSLSLSDVRLVAEGVVFRAEDKRIADMIPIVADTAAKATAAVAASLQEVRHSALFVFLCVS